MNHREYELTAADGMRLFAQSWSPEKTAVGVVAIVHGLGEHSGRYAETAEQFTRAGYLVLTLDQRGHGRTSGQRGHVRDYDLLLDDIDLLIGEAASRGEELPFFLYGHSLGANLVLNYALRRQPRLAGLVAASPLLRLTSPLPVWKTIPSRVMSWIFPRFSLRSGVKPGDLSHDPSALQAREVDSLVHGRVSARLGVQMIDAGQWALDHAGRLTLPTLLMHGSEDRLTSPEASVQFASRAGGRCTLRIWEGLYHELHEESERSEVIQFVIEWLEGRGQQTPR